MKRLLTIALYVPLSNYRRRLNDIKLTLMVKLTRRKFNSREIENYRIYSTPSIILAPSLINTSSMDMRVYI